MFQICSKGFEITFSLPYLDSVWKSIKISTNKPSIGPVVLEIAP